MLVNLEMKDFWRFWMSLLWSVSCSESNHWRWSCGWQLRQVGHSNIEAPETSCLSRIYQPPSLSDSSPLSAFHSASLSCHWLSLSSLPFFLSMSILLTRLKVISKAVFAGLLLLIKIWSAISSLGWWLRPQGTEGTTACAQSSARSAHFNTHQWLSGSCTSPQIWTWKHTLGVPQTDSY